MKLLALDTATDLCSVALWLDGDLRSREELAPRAHGALILAMISGLLEEVALDLGSLDAIGFGRGPGAFTGLRLAAAVAQGLGFAAQLPLIPVSDLRALAAQALAEIRGPCRALICQDARMAEVYWGCYERTGGVLRAVTVERVTAPAAVALPAEWCAAEDPAAASRSICAAGSGFAAYPQLQGMFAAVVSGMRSDLAPRAREIAQLAVADGLACAVSPEDALPVYLRDRVTAAP